MDLEAFAAALADIEESLQGGTHVVITTPQGVDAMLGWKRPFPPVVAEAVIVADGDAPARPL